MLDKENVRPAVPTPSKKSPKKSYYPGLGPENSPLSPSRSVDSGLNKKEWVFATPEKPVGGYKKDRKVLGSIERGLDKMKNMLTPRKYETVHRPSVITGKYNLFISHLTLFGTEVRGNILSPCPCWIKFCQQNFFQKFPNFFGGEN